MEVWFADEARIGQKNKITRRWARRGTRPAAPTDQRTASTYIFGAICPALGKGAALVLPRCNTAAIRRPPGAGAISSLIGFRGPARSVEAQARQLCAVIRGMQHKPVEGLPVGHDGAIEARINGPRLAGLMVGRGFVGIRPGRLRPSGRAARGWTASWTGRRRHR